MNDKNTKSHDGVCKKNCSCNRVIANDLYNKIRHNFEWLIYVDVDEFITTKKNITRTIRQELETTFKNVDCVRIPWVMMACNKLEKNPTSVLEENIFRWNHDQLTQSVFNFEFRVLNPKFSLINLITSL